MTLRDIGIWISETYGAFMRDVDIAFTASPLDWPLYLIVLAISLPLLTIGILFVMLITMAVAWNNFWSNPERKARFVRATDRVKRVAFLICVFLLIWTFVGFVTLIAFASLGFQNKTDPVHWAVVVIPTLIAGGIVYFAIRGRAENAKRFNRGKENSNEG